MKTGCWRAGVTLLREPSRVFSTPLSASTGAGAEFQGTGSPGVAMAGKPRVASTARPCQIDFRPLPSTEHMGS